MSCWRQRGRPCRCLPRRLDPNWLGPGSGSGRRAYAAPRLGDGRRQGPAAGQGAQQPASTAGSPARSNQPTGDGKPRQQDLPKERDEAAADTDPSGELEESAPAGNPVVAAMVQLQGKLQLPRHGHGHPGQHAGRQPPGPSCVAIGFGVDTYIRVEGPQGREVNAISWLCGTAHAAAEMLQVRSGQLSVRGAGVSGTRRPTAVHVGPVRV